MPKQAWKISTEGNKLDEALHYQVKMLESIYLENTGNGDFKIHKLPNAVQFAPIMDFETVQFDGETHILVVGNHYNSEVETVRYDASYGAMLLYKHGSFKVEDALNTGFVNKRKCQKC